MMNLLPTFEKLANCLRPHGEDPAPSLRDVFSSTNNFCARTPVHIVDEAVLRQLAKLHPYNDNLFKDCGRRDGFPEFLYIGPEGGTFFIMTDEQNRFIGSLTLRPFSGDRRSIEFAQISVHSNFTNIGVGTKLLETMQTYLNKERPEIDAIIINKFEQDGNRWIRPKLHKMASGFKAGLYERHDWPFDLIPLRHAAPH